MKRGKHQDVFTERPPAKAAPPVLVAPPVEPDAGVPPDLGGAGPRTGIARPAPISATPFRMSLTPGEIHSRAPVLGEHNAAILGELGIGPDEIANLAADGII